MCSKCLLAGLMEPQCTGEDDGEGNSGATSNHKTHSIVADYELLEPLGHGGMGVVWRARQRSLNRMVALKMIRTGEFADLEEIRRFQNEAEAVALLNHPNIVPIYEVGEDAGRHFFSMRLIEGGSLADWRGGGVGGGGSEQYSVISNRGSEMSNRGSLSGIVEVVVKVARAVHFAHQHGLLHRDLKPANILLDAEGEPLVVDFGLARLLGSESSLTATGDVLGSPAYMAPEQVTTRPEGVTTAADIYSLGAILFQLLTGRPPFQGATPLDTLRQVAEQEPPRPRSLNPAIDQDLETVCLKCLAKDPAHRYTSARALADDLERWQQGEPILARPTPLWELALKWMRRHPAAAAFLGLALVAPAVIITVLLFAGARITSERNRSQEQELITLKNLYAADMARAYHSLQVDDYDGAWRSLAAYRPSTTSSTPQASRAASRTAATTDLRGFEWRWLWQQVQGEARHSFAAHLGLVNGIAYSPDGRFVATVSADGTTKIWDAVQENLLRTIGDPDNPEPRRNYTDRRAPYHVHETHSASFSADSHKLLIGTEPARLKLWEAEPGPCLWNLQTNSLAVAIFSPVDPNLALALPFYPRTSLGFLDLASRSLTMILTNGRADAVCFTPNGRQFARWDRGARRIWLQNIPSGEVQASFDATGIYVLEMAFSPDGRTLAVCNMEKGRVELFDVATQTIGQPLPGRGRRLRTVAISPDGKWLASGGYDQAIQLWDLGSRQEVRLLRGHRAAIYCLAFSPDSTRLASGGYDGTVRFWDVAQAEPSAAITNVFGAFAFSPDGRWVITQDTNNLALLWDLPSHRIVEQWETSHFDSAVITRDGSLLTASTGTSNEAPCIHAISLHNSQLKTHNSQLLPGIPSPCSAIALSPDGRFTVTGHRDGTVAFWESRSGRLMHRAADSFAVAGGTTNRDVRTLAFSLDGRTVGAATYSSVCVNTWAMPQGRLLGRHGFIDQYELRLALSPDGQQAALGGVGSVLAIDLWDSTLSRQQAELHGHQDFIFGLAYSPDGRTLASGGRDGLLKLWHLPTRREIGTVLTLPRDTKFGQITFSPDGTWLGASDTAGTLHLLHAPALAELDAAMEEGASKK
jgi:WD40 repeat protein